MMQAGALAHMQQNLTCLQVLLLVEPAQGTSRMRLSWHRFVEKIPQVTMAGEPALGRRRAGRDGCLAATFKTGSNLLHLQGLHWF